MKTETGIVLVDLKALEDPTVPDKEIKIDATAQASRIEGCEMIRQKVNPIILLVKNATLWPKMMLLTNEITLRSIMMTEI